MVVLRCAFLFVSLCACCLFVLSVSCRGSVIVCCLCTDASLLIIVCRLSVVVCCVPIVFLFCVLFVGCCMYCLCC